MLTHGTDPDGTADALPDLSVDTAFFRWTIQDFSHQIEAFKTVVEAIRLWGWVVPDLDTPHDEDTAAPAEASPTR